MDADYLREVADLVLRFLHVVAGIAWIGASFYFIRLDLGLSPPAERADLDKGVAGEYWGVHGGGFYHSQKYKVAPRVLPEPLHWFKWEAYTTWLSGFALLVLLYWSDAETRLIDPSVADLSAWEAIGASALLLLGGLLVYELACRLLRDDLGVAITTALLVVAVAWLSGELFAARAAYLQVGAVLGTIMAANVFLVIIPAHRELVRAKQEGREPDPAPGLRAKQRSVHNNYLTLPVVFTMLAGHFPLTFGSDRPWLALLAIFAILVVVRHFFNLMHGGRMPLTCWAWPRSVRSRLRSRSSRTSRRRRPKPSPTRRRSRSRPRAASPATSARPRRSASSWRPSRIWRLMPTRSSGSSGRTRCRRATPRA